MRNTVLRCVGLLLLLCLLSCAACAEGATLDLSRQEFGSFEALTAQIDAANATVIDLTDVPLSNAQRKTLLAAYPDAHFLWTVDLWGVSISSEDTEVTFTKKQAGKADELCDALDCLPGMQSVYMWDANLSREDRSKLHSRYPDVFFGWEIHINAGHTLRTDATAFSTLGRKPNLYSNNMGNFAFCPNLKALDFGHNPVQKLDFLEDCAKLKVLIAADGLISDLSPLASQTELEYIELFINKITDISPLANLTKLRDVNLAFNDIADLSPLYDLPNLERVWLMQNPRLTEEEIERLREHQPDCQIVTRSWGSTGNIWPRGQDPIPGTSWRHHPHYDTVFYIFNGGGYVDWDVPVPSRADTLQ